MKTNYRIEKATGKVYREHEGAFHYHVSFHSIGATPRMSEKRILELVDEWEYNQLMFEFQETYNNRN